jgi:transketolase
MRMAVAFSECNVKMVGTHGGISIGEDGASQMSIEDFALAAALPGVAVIGPADEFSARDLIKEAANYPHPVYVRVGRPKAPLIYNKQGVAKIGKANRLREGKDVSIVANGLLVFEALSAAETLAAEGIQASVVDLHTIKPLDEALLVEEAKKGRMVVAEEHQIWGGVGSAVARFLAGAHPCKMEFVAINDTFAESGAPDEVMEKYGMTAQGIVRAVKKVLSK